MREEKVAEVLFVKGYGVVSADWGVRTGDEFSANGDLGS